MEKDELLEDFKRFLEAEDMPSFVTNDQVDLKSLFSELTALKTEVKTESRQFKNTLDTLDSLITVTQEEKKALSEQCAENRRKQEIYHADFSRNMLLDYIDSYDRIALGSLVLQNYQPVDVLFKHSRKEDIKFIKHLKQGQEMTLKRFENLLRKYQVYPISCVGKILDPVTMCAVETTCIPTIENGRVIEELRKGFLFQDQVLRLAEVRVNKLED